MHPDSPDNSTFDAFQEMISLLIVLKERVTDDANLMWTNYDTAQEIRDKIDRYIRGLQKGDRGMLLSVGSLFYPTSDFQRMAMDSGWGDDYLVLADRYDKIAANVKH